MSEQRSQRLLDTDALEWMTGVYLHGWKGYQDLSDQELGIEAWYLWSTSEAFYEDEAIRKEFPARERRRIWEWIARHDVTRIGEAI